MAVRSRTVTGDVVKKTFAEGSKSEHQAVMLIVDGKEWRLKRLGGNPFQDPELDKLVGKRIRCDAMPHENTLILKTWEIENE